MNGEKIATRVAFGEAIAKLGGKYKNIVVLDADLGSSVKTNKFRQYFADRTFNVGISEADMVGTAAGLSLRGKIPFACTFAIFATGRAWEQVRQSVCYPNLNVKIIGSHAGLMTGEDGATHQALEDIALMRALPNMKVFCPADAVECKQVIESISEDFGPAYVRLGRSGVPVIYSESYKFKIGRGSVVREGKDIVIFATGSMVSNALKAAELLNKDKISAKVINICSIKPIDEELIVDSVKKVSQVFTVEDHNIIGGLGSAVCEVLSEFSPKKVYRIGVRDRFGESGKTEDLYEKFGLDARGIYEQVRGKVVGY